MCRIGAEPRPLGLLADPVAELVPQLDLETYKATIKGLTQFGDRRQGTERNRKALDWIEAQLKATAARTPSASVPVTPSRASAAPAARPQPARAGGPRRRRAAAPCSANARAPASTRTRWPSPTRRLRALNAEPTPEAVPRENVYCTKIGTTHPEEMYIVGAHMDGIGWGEAANDDGSGTALVMELARIFSMPGRGDRALDPLHPLEQRRDRPARRQCLRRPAQGLAGHGDAEGVGQVSRAEVAGHDPARHDAVRPRHAAQLDANGKPCSMQPPEQRRAEADVNIEFQSTAKYADGAAKLAWALRAANEKYATDYPAASART